MSPLLLRQVTRHATHKDPTYFVHDLVFPVDSHGWGSSGLRREGDERQSQQLPHGAEMQAQMAGLALGEERTMKRRQEDITLVGQGSV